MGDMAPLFFSFGGQNYSRYLSWIDAFLSNIEASHRGSRKLLEARSLIPGNLAEVDKALEIDLMKWLKSSCGAGGAGITGILQNVLSFIPQPWICVGSLMLIVT